MLAVLVLDPFGVIVHASPGARTLLGDCVGRPCDEIVAAQGTDGGALCTPGCSWRDLVRTGRFDRRGTLPDGRTVRIVCSALADGFVASIGEDR